jgi:hypothetical protein
MGYRDKPGNDSLAEVVTFLSSPVPGSSPRMFRRPTEAAGRKIANQAWVEIGPVPIFALDQIDLPVSLPLLHCLLTLDCRHHIAERLVVDECVDL